MTDLFRKCAGSRLRGIDEDAGKVTKVSSVALFRPTRAGLGWDKMERPTLGTTFSRSGMHWLLRGAALAIAAAGVILAYWPPGQFQMQRDEEAIMRIDRRLGIIVATVDPEVVGALDLPADSSGLVIASLGEGRPAARAGLHAGDVIEKIGSRPVTDAQAAADALDASGPSPVSIRVHRAGREINVTVPAA